MTLKTMFHVKQATRAVECARQRCTGTGAEEAITVEDVFFLMRRNKVCMWDCHNNMTCMHHVIMYGCDTVYMLCMYNMFIVSCYACIICTYM